MDQFGVSALADWLEAETDALLSKKTKLDLDRVFAAVDDLKVLKNPATVYPQMREETYGQTESDKKLSLLHDDRMMIDSHDRIMVNHVDGSITDDVINFQYNHDTAYGEEGYKARKDLEILKFGLEVIGAVVATGHLDTVRAALAPDAVVSLVTAAAAFAAWQQD